MGKLDGKVALITGGSIGIGEATALAFTREGAKVVIASRGAERGEAIAQKIIKAGGEAIFIKTDVSKASDVKAVVNKAVEKYGRLDCAFNNAGIMPTKVRLAEETEETWDSVVNIDLKGVWLCMKYEILQMQKQGGGVIINNSSVAGLRASRVSASYGASKWGVVGLTKTAALEYGKDGIRVNVVCPALILTPFWTTRSEPNIYDNMAADLPLARMGKPEEVAEAVVFLCSDGAAFITGAALTIDGGQFT